ncbi:MAG: HlyD family efflux transporter periplasmic adaptor subunit [Lachnospiraceae bacterium]|nr:HlyD family efflux transporter periplasmic adaptor subunit [Lachnospiraceae bacterium]
MKSNDRQWKKLRAEFLPEAMEIIEKPASPLGNATIWFVFALLGVSIIWACLGRIDEVAVARGEILVDSGSQKIQAAGTGIITEVKVKEGECVKKGDILYVMNREVEQANVQYSEGEIGLNELRLNLISKMLSGQDIEKYDKTNLDEEQLQVLDYMITLQNVNRLSENEYIVAFDNAKKMYELAGKRVKSMKMQSENLDEQRSLKLESESTGSIAEKELELLKLNYSYAKNNEAKYKELYEQGAKSKSEWEEKKHELDTLEKQIEIKRLENEKALISEGVSNLNIDYEIEEQGQQLLSGQGTFEEYKNNYETAELNLDNFRQQRDQKLLEMRTETLEKLKELGVANIQQYYSYESKEVKAPFDGIVKTLIAEKPGTVVTETQEVAEIVPSTDHIIVEVECKNADIGYVRVGQAVDVKVDTYDYQKFGMLSGTVFYISPDSLENERQENVYKVQIELSDDSFHDMELSQGMECSADIKTGSRRIIDFFMEPLTDALKSSIRER